MDNIVPKGKSTFVKTIFFPAALQEGGGGRVGNFASSQKKSQFKHIYTNLIN